MKTVTSISGGQSSAYIAALYPSDSLIFSLVRTSDERVRFKDKGIAKIVSDRIQTDFVGTLEDDKIIYTILDLEQFTGRSINWVTGKTFDHVINIGNRGYLPNVMKRFCTTEMKIRPIFKWWRENFDKPVIMNLGFRANEKRRADAMVTKLNKNGLSEFKDTNSKHPDGRNKWETIEWRKPKFPLIDDFVYKEDIVKFWKNKPVRFAKYNNCVGCFHRSASFLNEISKLHPDKFDWFVRQEQQNKGFFKKEVSYNKIKKINFTLKMNFESEGCSSGFCGF
jgi:hypothetical protein